MKPNLPLAAAAVAALVVSIILAVAFLGAGCGTESAPTTSQVTGLTLEQVRNAECAVQFDGGMLVFTLVDGSYQSGQGGGDPSQADRVTVTMSEVVAFGDLNGDGVGDAVIAVHVTKDGSGNGQGAAGNSASTYVIALVAKGGKPVQGGYHLAGLGALVDSLASADGQIVANATIPGQEDPTGAPKVPIVATLRLPFAGGLLLHTSQTSETPAGDVRAVTIGSPEPGATVSDSFTIAGAVTIAPFENNLVYHVYNDQMTELAVGPLMVDAPDYGAPGTFRLVMDLASSDYSGRIFVTVSDLSAADGSILAMGSIELVVE
ncbi:MAG: hypothetical protein A2133_06120 [Actinobacteria bacterium RBG_16_64_13]|nr:MAG: hypothetical protein A2133_06120 [Actinobacteria bacterium RBG_16_64_13]